MALIYRELIVLGLHSISFHGDIAYEKCSHLSPKLNALLHGVFCQSLYF